MNKSRRAAVILLIASLSCFAATGQVPKSLEPVFSGIERGKPFHPVWPPIVGQTLVGTIVIAGKPNKPEAYFGSIEKFRNPSFVGAFESDRLGFVSENLTQAKSLEVKVAYSQLDTLAKASKSALSASSLAGKVVPKSGKPTATNEASKSLSPAASSSPEAAPKGTGVNNAALPCGSGGTQSGKMNPERPSGSANPSSSPGVEKTASASTKSQSTSSKGQQKSSNTKESNTPTGNSTGIDFSSISNAQVQICGLSVVYYTIPTLTYIENGQALDPTGSTWLTADKRGWLVHRALVADSLEYTLTSSKAIDAGFFAKLVAWIPGVSVKYKSANSVSIRTTSPLTIGYKLWRPGLPVTGAGAETADSIGLDADGVDAVLSGKRK